MSQEKHHVLAFGRMNPVTSGHEAVVNTIHSVAAEHHAGHTLVVSHSQDKKKNPLTPEQKVKHAKNAFKDTTIKAASKEAPTILHHAAELHRQGVTHLHVVAGSDRKDEMHNLLHKYNGQKSAHGEYNFKKITVHSSGERDPDAEGTTGMSASKMREHAAAGNEKEFHKGAPSTMSTANKKAMYKDVRKGMDINEGIKFSELISKISEARGTADKHWNIAQDHKEKASRAVKGSEEYHTHMADHHDSMSRYHEELGQSTHAESHADKAETHHEKAFNAARGIGESAMTGIPNTDRTDKKGTAYNPHRKEKTSSDIEKINKAKETEKKQKTTNGGLNKYQSPAQRKATVNDYMKLLKHIGEENQLEEAHKIGDKVIIHKGPRDVIGKVGHIGEIRKPWVGAEARYTIDHEGGSIQLMKHHFKKYKAEEVKEEFNHIHTKIEHKDDHKLITHGPDFSLKVGKEHHEKIGSLNHDEKHEFKCMDGNEYGIHKRGDRLHFAAHPSDSGQMSNMTFHISHDEFNGKDPQEIQSKTPDVTKLSSYAQMLGHKANSHPDLLSGLEKAHLDAINAMNESHVEFRVDHRDKVTGDVKKTMADHEAKVSDTTDKATYFKVPKHKADSFKTAMKGHGVRAELAETLNPSMGAGKYIDDFQKSDAPQFKGKSKEKRRMMGIAAFLKAKREVSEARMFATYNDAQAAAAPGQKPKLDAGTNKYILVSEETIQEATVDTKKYSWGTMKTVHHGADFSIPLHPEHHQEIAKLKDGQEHHFKDETGRHWGAYRRGENVHFQSADTHGAMKTKVPHKTMTEEVEQIDEISSKLATSYKAGATSSMNRAQGAADTHARHYANNHKDSSLASHQKFAAKVDKRKAGIAAADKRIKEETEQLDEANHREFASQGKMHPDMAKHMTVGQHQDYYEPKTGDKVHGKVMHNDGKEVHVKQTHDSYNPKKVGTVHKFKVTDKLDEAAPVNVDKVNAAGDKPHEEKWEKAKKVKKESLSFADFINTLQEHQYNDSGTYKHKGTYGSAHVEPDEDEDDKPAKPAAEKRGRGRPKGAGSGARQVGSTAAKKKSFADYTGYKLHLPNSNK